MSEAWLNNRVELLEPHCGSQRKPSRYKVELLRALRQTHQYSKVLGNFQSQSTDPLKIVLERGKKIHGFVPGLIIISVLNVGELFTR